MKNNLTQEKSAEISDLTPIHISNIERGKAQVSLHTLGKIADALNVNIAIDKSDKKIQIKTSKTFLRDIRYLALQLKKDIKRTINIYKYSNKKSYEFTVKL